MEDDEIKVRLAVAVDRNGKYCAGGYNTMTDENAFDCIIDELEPGEARYYIEATLRKPKLSVLIAEPDSIVEVATDNESVPIDPIVQSQVALILGARKFEGYEPPNEIPT